MNNSNHRPLTESDVVSVVIGPNNRDIKTSTFQTQEIHNLLSDLLEDREFLYISLDTWVKEGVEGKLLSPGTNWVKGKVKLQVVFEAEDEMTIQQKSSPLDDIRQKLDELA